MKLEENARDWWKWYTTHAYALMAAYLAGIAWFEKSMPKQFELVPDWVWFVGAIFCVVCFIIAQMVQQVSTSKATP